MFIPRVLCMVQQNTIQHFLFLSGYNKNDPVYVVFILHVCPNFLERSRFLIFPASSWCTTAPFRSQRRSCVACRRTGRSPGLSPRCLCLTLWVERWCRRSTRKTTRLPACHSCRHRREYHTLISLFSFFCCLQLELRARYIVSGSVFQDMASKISIWLNHKSFYSFTVLILIG